MGERIGVRAAAQILGVHENTVRAWYRSGRLAGTPLRDDGKFLRFDLDYIKRFVARSEVADIFEYTVVEIAKAVVYNTSSGLCEYGKVCAMCDCFADGDDGKYRDSVARAAARAALAVWERDS